MTMLNDRQQLSYIAAQAADARLNVELETEGMTLNIGPQHPATHGTLRIIARLDGEQVVWAEPGCGYMHRGYEKLTEVRTFPQVTTLINRIDWTSGYANEIPFIVAAERLMGIEVPERAEYLRVILAEVTRLANHCSLLGFLLSDAGAWGTRTNTPDSLQNIKEGDERAELDPRLDIDRSRDAVINKRMASVFHETLIPSLLVWHKVDTVILTGGNSGRVGKRGTSGVRCRSRDQKAR